MTAVPVPSEHAEQSVVVQWFWMQHPALRGCLFAVPNGAHLAGTPRQRAAKMAKMKAEGFQPGVSDLFLMVARGGCHGLWIEMKRRNASPSDTSREQRTFLDRAATQGYEGAICHGAQQAIAVITNYLSQQARAAA